MIKLGNETCDDGNNVNEDGCSSLCQIELNSFCNSFFTICAVCGDG